MDQQQKPAEARSTQVPPPVTQASAKPPLEEQSMEGQLLEAANQVTPSTVQKSPLEKIIRPPQIHVRLDWEAYSTMPPKQKKKCDFIVEWVCL
jgi:hypothetical protein